MEKGLTMADEYIRPKFKRKQYLTNKRFQLKYVGLILALVFLTAALCSYVVYYTSMISLGEKLANVYPQGRLVSIVRIVNFRILLSILFITPLVVLAGILASHKIAGPIFRMETFMRNMADGDFTGNIVLRKNDELMNLSAGMNGLSAKLRSSFQTQKSQMDKVLVELNSIKNTVEAKPVDTAKVESLLSKLYSEVRALIAEMDKYKV